MREETGKGINVLSESMKFGKLLNRVRNDGKVYLNYKELKQCIGETGVFVEKLKREVRYVDVFFKREEAETLEQLAQASVDGNEARALVVSLQRFVVINAFAVLKIALKHDRRSPATPCKDTILAFLAETSFYTAFTTSPVFTTPSTATEKCCMCFKPTEYKCVMASCQHVFCWDCVIKMEARELHNCAVCGEAFVLSSGAILAEDVLGVGPRVVPRRVRRRGGAKDADGDSKPINILAESDDEKAPAGPKSSRYYCKDCSIVLNSFRQAQIHITGQRHLDQVERLIDRYQKEGIVYESPGLKTYDDATVIEGVPKPRRSRGGVKNKLRQQQANANLAGQQPPVQPVCRDAPHEPYPPLHNNLGDPHMDASLNAGEYPGHSPYMQHPPMIHDTIHQPFMYNFPYMSIQETSMYRSTEYSEPATPTPTSSSMGPYFPPATAQRTHAFEVEKINTVLKESIETVFSKKDLDGSALQAIKAVLVEENGCSSLVDEIFRGIFNGENTMNYADLCKVLVDSEEPEVALQSHEFTHLLLQRCRATVTKMIHNVEVTYEMSQEQIDSIEEAELRERFKRNSAVKLSADLFAKGIMPEALVHVCLQTMLFGRTISPKEELELFSHLDEDNVGTACRILTTVGDLLYASSPQFVEKYCEVLEHGFGSLMSSRIKRKVKSVISSYKAKESTDAEDATNAADAPQTAPVL